MTDILVMDHIVGAIVFSFIGLLILGISFLIFEKFTPGTLWKEIIEEHNTALAIIVGSMALAISHIIASAIHG